MDILFEYKFNDNFLIVFMDWFNVWINNCFEEGIMFFIWFFLNDWLIFVEKLILKEYVVDNNLL